MKKDMLFKPLRALFLAFALLFGICFSSCNFLRVDDYFDDTMKFDSIFTKYDYLVQYMWGTTDQFPDESKIYITTTSPGPLATDEMFTSFQAKDNAQGLYYALGGINADNIGSYEMNIWGKMYQIIRKCNNILARKNEAGLTAVQDEEITGYTHMIRGYAYYNLIQAYGPCIILGDDILPNNEQPAAYNYSRSTYDESVDYCCNELELAAKYIPKDLTSNFFGRPSRGAAFALIARLRLQQASPLYNGGQAARTTFGTWKRSEDGAYYVSQTYDESRWAIAAAACRRVIKMGKYKLHTVLEDPGMPARALPSSVDITNPDFKNIDYYRSYSEMFTGETLGSKNPEFIWGKESNEIRLTTRHSFPNEDYMGGYNALCITQKLVDAYYMVDGRDKNNASDEYPYHVASGTVTDDYFSTNVEEFSGYKIPVGVYGMYLNRENRFYATVGFSGRYWAANTCTENMYKNYSVWYHQSSTGGRDLFSGKGAAVRNPLDYPSTGYVLTKWIHADDAWKGNGSSQIGKFYPIIRYAEILLGYAEALNHLTRSYTVELPSVSGGNQPAESYTVDRNPSEIKIHFDQIRNRVGLPGLTPEEMGADETTLDNIIKREYMIEFACENRRYYDVRRWGMYEETEKAGIYGMHLGEEKSGYYQTPIPVNQANNRNRVIDRKMILLPLPKSEVRRVEHLDQNPGWES